MRIASLNIGGPQLVARNGKTVSTSIGRRPVSDGVQVDTLGFAGDRSSNLRVHGGPDKAVCCYPLEHYPHWRERLGRDMAIPSFGENLTTEGLVESEVCLGDIFEIGTATFQISQPRQPCGTLAMWNESIALPGWVNENGFTGWYFRVLKPGRVAPGDAIRRVERPLPGDTVESLLRAMLAKPPERARLVRLISLEPLSAGWRETFQKRVRILDGEETDESAA